MTMTGKYHGNAVLIGHINGFLIPDGAAGSITAVTPALPAASMVSPKGKNASELMTEPFAFSPASAMAISAEPTRFIWPAPTP